MTGVFIRHKVLILFISLIIISLFVFIAYLMPKSSKIPSKGVFVLETGIFCVVNDWVLIDK